MRNVDELAFATAPGRRYRLWLFCFSCSPFEGRPMSGSSLTLRSPGPTFPSSAMGRSSATRWISGKLGHQPPREAPRPLVVFFHGGGFVGGDKKSVPGWLVTRCLAEGISVASVNYRLSTQSPFPAPMLDGGRAIQFLRLKAADLGIDPRQDRGLRQLGRRRDFALGRVP